MVSYSSRCGWHGLYSEGRVPAWLPVASHSASSWHASSWCRALTQALLLCRPDDTGVFDAVFVSRPEDLSDLEDILPSLDDVLIPHADFGSDSDLPLWDSMLSGISCPGMQSHSDQTVAEGLPQGDFCVAKNSLADAEVHQPSTSNSACSCDLQQGAHSHGHTWQLMGGSPLQHMRTGQHMQQQQAVHSLNEPTSSRDSNPCAASPESGDDRGGSSKKRKVDASSDEDCSGRHPSPSSAPKQVSLCYLPAPSANWLELQLRRSNYV